MIVVKAGGRALESNMDGILRSISRRVGEEVIFVHGGGDIVTRFEEALGIEPRFVVSPQGIRSRLTTKEEMEVFNMVMSGRLNKEIVAHLHRLGAKAVGLSGVDGGLMRAQRKKRIVIVDERGRRRVIEGGYTGSIKEVNTDLLKTLTRMGYIVVVAPVALGYEGELLNVDADQAASAIAGALMADQLIILTDVEGVIIDGALVKEIRVGEVEGLRGKIGVGMNRKLLMCARSVESGVSKAIIASGLVDDPLENVEKGAGTTIIK